MMAFRFKRLKQGLTLVSDADIQALIDEELEQERSRQIMATILLCPRYMDRYKELFRQRALLKLWWRKCHQEH